MAVPSYLEDIALLIGRILLVLLFFLASLDKLSHFAATTTILHKSGVPFPYLMLSLAVIMELFGSLMVIFGYYTRLGSIFLILFSFIVTLIMHQFWDYKTGFIAEIEVHQFFKNLAIIGGLLYVMVFGPGRISFDYRWDIPIPGRKGRRS